MRELAEGSGGHLALLPPMGCSQDLTLDRAHSAWGSRPCVPASGHARVLPVLSVNMPLFGSGSPSVRQLRILFPLSSLILGLFLSVYKRVNQLTIKLEHPFISLGQKQSRNWSSRVHLDVGVWLGTMVREQGRNHNECTKSGGQRTGAGWTLGSGQSQTSGSQP